MQPIGIGPDSALFNLLRTAVAPRASAVPASDVRKEPAKVSPPKNEDAVKVKISDATKAFVGEAQKGLTEAEQQEVQKLRSRDREVRAHEEAHASALGPYALGGPKYDYTTGPDKVRYAVGGHVKVDMSSEGDPEKDIEKARTIKEAALAPGKPSPEDRAVAAQAQQMEASARQAKAKEDTEERKAEVEEKAEGEEGSDLAAGEINQAAESPASKEVEDLTKPEESQSAEEKKRINNAMNQFSTQARLSSSPSFFEDTRGTLLNTTA